MTTIDDEQTVCETAPRFTSEPVKVRLDRFLKMVNSIMHQPGVPLDVANAVQAAAWLAQVDAFRDLEESLMLLGKYDALLPNHRLHLSELITDGEQIVWAVGKLGMASASGLFTLEDLQATLDSLHTTFRCEHGPKNSQKTNELIAQLFDGAKS
jgi:hypothetical protein